MPCFNPSQAHHIRQNIGVLARRLWNVTAKPLSYEDFMSLFVPVGIRADFRVAAKHGRNHGGRARFDWGGTAVVFCLRSEDDVHHFPPPLPREMLIQPDAPAELVESINTWTHRAANVSQDCGRITKVFETLNEGLTRGQMRAVWPSIIAILNANPGDLRSVQLAKELQAMRPSAASDVVIPHGVIQACRKTAATIATMSIIPTDLPLGDPHPDAEVVMVGSHGHSFDEPDLGQYMGLTF